MTTRRSVRTIGVRAKSARDRASLAAHSAQDYDPEHLRIGNIQNPRIIRQTAYYRNLRSRTAQSAFRKVRPSPIGSYPVGPIQSLMFFASWCLYGFSIVDFGRFSINPLLATAGLLGLSALWRGTWLNTISLCFLGSTLLPVAASSLAGEHWESTNTHLGQMLIATGVASGAVALSLGRSIPAIKTALTITTACVVGFGVYQLAARSLDLPYAYLPITNLQIQSDNGLQRGASKIAKGMFRVSSTFPEPSDLTRFLLWAVAFAIPASRDKVWSAIGVTAVIGVLIGQSLGGYLALAVVVSIAVWGNALGSKGSTLGVFIAAAAASMIIFFPDETWNTTSRLSLIATDLRFYLATSERFSDMPDLLRLISQAPLLGYGVGSSSQIAPSLLIGSSLSLLLIERGIIGAGLFLLPYLLTISGLLRWGQPRHNKITLMALLLVALELINMLSFAALYFPTSFVALGIAWGHLHTHKHPAIPSQN